MRNTQHPKARLARKGGILKIIPDEPTPEEQDFQTVGALVVIGFWFIVFLIALYCPVMLVRGTSIRI